LHTIEKNNKALKGALPDNYFSRLGLDVTKLASLLDTINDIDTTKDPKHDVVGKVYEYFLSKFALAEGKGKGEFYTPKSIVNLIAEMIEPYKGIIYDPACGSGGMFVQSIKFIEAHNGNNKEISIYGQEYNSTTYKLEKMNLAIRGISGNLGEKAADTFTDDQHKDLKAEAQSKQLAEKMSEAISKALGTKNRGAKPFSGTVMDVAEQQGTFPVVLTESYFLNPYTQAQAEERSRKAAVAIADVVTKWFA
jgi:type I restriction-modification system DNA methylase subunit